MLRVMLAAVIAMGAGLLCPGVALAEEKKGEIASEVSTGTSDIDGTRHSKDSDWTKFTVPDNFAINTTKTVVHVLNEQGSEHTYEMVYEDFVDITIQGFTISQPRTIKVKTHARSSKGSKGGKGAMEVKVEFFFANFK